MNERKKNYIKIGIFILLTLWLGFLLARKIDLSTADLGRHLKNGQWVVENHFNIFEKNSPLFENYYSYTNPNFPAINHHWGSGVLFYLVWKIAGFPGLSLLYIFASLAAFAILFWFSAKAANFTLAAMLSFFLMPLMAERVEIRPEVFSVLFAAIFFFIIGNYFQGKIRWKWLLFLIPLQIIWVNFHVYFFLGLGIAGVFWLSKISQIIFEKLADDEFQKKVGQAKVLTVFLFLMSLASLLNPFGISGLLYPLKIFQNYGYTIVENKSVSFVENYGIQNPNFFEIKIVLILLAVSWLVAFILQRKKISPALLMLSIFFGAIGWLAIRNFTLLGFFALPILAINFKELFPKIEDKMSLAKENAVAFLYIILAVLGFWGNYNYVAAHFEASGIGLRPGVQSAADFIRKNSIQGPIFNNYDVGGYLIFNLPASSAGRPASEKVFVDNRPEAYPASFFSEAYKPMQEKESLWQEQEKKWNFQAIIIYWHDITPWGQYFAEFIQNDQDWQEAYKDDFIKIYLRRGGTNQKLIDKL
jgi:hypothetical protein